MDKPTIFLVSGGTGTSGNQLLKTALAQFTTNDIAVHTVAHLRRVEQLEPLMAQVAASGGILVHTLVDESLRAELVRLASVHHITQVDLMGSLLTQLAHYLEQNPIGQPGLYRKMHEQDLRRFEAIEFAVSHDDGKRAHELAHADIVLTGVSRVGKTPLSIYLSTLGWKVANVPIVKDVTLPAKLFEIDHRRVVGLTIEPGQLVAYRQQRGHHLGIGVGASYMTPAKLLEELEFARDVYRRGKFSTVDTTDKPIEECADEIIVKVSRRLELNAD